MDKHRNSLMSSLANLTWLGYQIYLLINVTGIDLTKHSFYSYRCFSEVVPVVVVRLQHLFFLNLIVQFTYKGKNPKFYFPTSFLAPTGCDIVCANSN